LIGASGDVLEQGMFVLNAELRKWNFDNQALLQNGYKVYTHPDVTPSGFEPKANGDTLTGLVGNVAALVDVDNIEQMRTLLDELFDRYENDCDYDRFNIMQSWLTAAYPTSPSGHLSIFDGGFFFQLNGRTFLRPPLQDITGGDEMTDTDLHWLGGSGVLFDIDFGEVIFQPFPFPGKSSASRVSTNTNVFQAGPCYPSFQKTDGSVISMTGREASDWDSPRDVNFAAVGSGKIQLDGYAILPETKIRLIEGKDNEWNFVGNGAADFTNPVQGLRVVNAGVGTNDDTARTYWTPKVQSSGVRRIITSTDSTDRPGIGVPSGGPVSLWPPGSYREFDGTFVGTSNQLLYRSFEEASDGTSIIDSRASLGYHVFDDCIWVTGPGAAGSGSITAGGIHPISPHNGDLLWCRTADRTVATSGRLPIAPGVNDPGHFQVHRGLVPFGANGLLRISPVWEQNRVGSCGTGDGFNNTTFTVFFQQYNLPTMSYVEQASTYTACDENGYLGPGEIIASLIHDGTNYFISERSIRPPSTGGNVTRWTSALVFDGAFNGPRTSQRFYANGDYLYNGGTTASDPLTIDANMNNYGAASGIGKWSIDSEPASLTEDLGSFTHNSAKPIVAEVHVGYHANNQCKIHDIIFIASADATHVTPGLWVLIEFSTVMYLMRLTEEATFYKVEVSVRLSIVGTNDSTIPYQIIHLDVD
jgi:hypothetical protein